MSEETRLRNQLTAQWFIDGKPLTPFKSGDEEWRSLNLAPKDSRGGPGKSGPDRVFHDGDNTIVVVEEKVAKKGSYTKPKLCSQVFGYGLQAKELTANPGRKVRRRSKRASSRPFSEICADSGFACTPDTRIVLALVTFRPEDAKDSVTKDLDEYLAEHLTQHDFDADLREGAMPDWREAIFARMPNPPSDFSWAVVEDVNTPVAREIHLHPMPGRSFAVPRA
jgi:hypothetical protein